MKSKNLPEALRAKKQLEEDEQALKNRVKLLEREEREAYRKAEEAQKQARDIHLARKAKEEEQEERNKSTEKNIRELEERKVAILLEKEKRKNAYNFNMAYVEQSKRDAANKIRDILKQDAQKRDQMKDTFITGCKLKVQKVQNEAKIGSERVKNFRKQKAESCRDVYEKRLEEDLAIKEMKEKEIEELERQEYELIKRLQNTQMMHQQAIQDLDSASTKVPKYMDAIN